MLQKIIDNVKDKYQFLQLERNEVKAGYEATGKIIKNLKKTFLQIGSRVQGMNQAAYFLLSGHNMSIKNDLNYQAGSRLYGLLHPKDADFLNDLQEYLIEKKENGELEKKVIEYK